MTETTNGNGNGETPEEEEVAGVTAESVEVSPADVVTPMIVGTGTPPTSPNFGLPRYSLNDIGDYPASTNAIVDILDAAAAKRGAILDADINASAAVQEAKLNLATDAAVGVGSRRTLGGGAQQAMPGNATSANTASLVDLKPTTHSTSYSASVGDLAIQTGASTNVTLPAAPTINGAQVGVIAAGYDVTVNRSGSDSISPGGLTATVKANTATVFSYSTSAGIWYALQSGGTGGGASGPVATMAARAHRAAALTLTQAISQALPLDTLDFDTSSMWRPASGGFACPTTGYYQVNAEMWLVPQTTNQRVDFMLFRNGTQVSKGTVTNNNVSGTFVGYTLSDIWQFNAGDVITLGVYLGAGTNSPLQIEADTNYLSMVLLASVPGAVGPVTPARAYASVNNWTSTGTARKVPLDAASYDPGGNFSTANNRYVCPASGFYQVNAQVALPNNVATNLSVSIYKNGAVVCQSILELTTAGGNVAATVGDVISCNAGDYIELWVNSATTLTYFSGPANAFLSVVQVGNLAATPASTACARAYRNAAFSIGVANTWTKIPLDTMSFDTSGMVQLSNGRLVCPVAGYYQVEGGAQFNATGVQRCAVALYKNGVAMSYAESDANASGWTPLPVASDVIQCNAGDYLELYVYGGAVTMSVGSSNTTFLTASLLTPLSGTAGPNTAARAYRAAALSLAANAWTKVAVDTVTADPGSNVNTANGRYVCPATGTYQVSGQVAISPGATGSYTAAIWKNGNIGAADGLEGMSVYATTAQLAQLTVSGIISCNAGDYLELYANNGTGTAAAVTNLTGYNNHLSVVQVGNSMNFSAAGGDLTGNYPNPVMSTQGMNKHLQMATPQAMAVNCGTGTVTFSNSTTSNAVTINHGLPNAPKAISIMAVTGGTYYLGCIFATQPIGTTQFNVQAVTTGASVNGTVNFYWIAMG